MLVPRGGSIRGVWYLGKGYSFVHLDARYTRDYVLSNGASYINGSYVYIKPWGPNFNLEDASYLCFPCGD